MTFARSASIRPSIEVSCGRQRASKSMEQEPNSESQNVGAERSAVSSTEWLGRRELGTMCLREWRLWGAWILLERHGAKCTCSYNRDFRGRAGVTLPACKARNSWRVVWWRWNERLYDLRWTLPSWWPSRSNMPSYATSHPTQDSAGETLK